MENTNSQLTCIFSSFHLNANFVVQWTTKQPIQPSPYGRSRPPHQIHLSFGWSNSLSQTAARLLHMVLQSCATNSPFITIGRHYAPPKLSLSMEGLGPPFNTSFFLDQPYPLPQMAFQLSQPFFQNTCSFLADQQTDRPTERTWNLAYANSW